MVKLRKSHNKLKIILCSVLGAIVAVGGVLGIWKLSTTLSGDKVIDAPDNTVSVRKELPSGATYTQLHSDGLDTLGYLAYVLDRQEYYHSVANTVSTALIATQYTNSFKDYKDGIMLSSDFTYGFTGAGTQSCFVPDGNANGEGAGVYMRTSSGSVNGSTTGTGANWNDDVVYYDKEGYLYKYGQYSTEMTVYILNEETVLSWDDVVENGDGTYSQTFYLDAEKAAYYYQYAMQTRGGLDTLPEFESITLTFTFDDNYRVLRIDATEVSEITYIFSMSSTSQTTTTYSYEQETFDEAHYDYFDSYYSQYVGQLETGGDEPELDALTLLGTAFADVVNGTGDQFEATVTLGDSVYYGRIYLNVPMSAFSSSDVIGALDVRLALSADSLFDSQDLYIQLKDGEVSGYYSSDFALKVNINDFSQLISKFENWVSSLGGSSDTEVLAETSSDSGFSLEDILNGLVLTEREGGATIALNLDDLFGIGLSAELNFTSSEGENGTTYAFANASVGNISYNGSPISLSLALTPSSAETISHEESDSPFDLTVAANSLYELLNSETVSAQLTLEGDKLADVLANYNLADLGGSIDDLRLEITGSVDINGVTVGAQARIYRAGDNSDVLNADVYYEIDPSAGDYGTAYLNIKNILGAECDVKAYSNVSELVSAIEKIIVRFGSEGGSAEVSALAEDSATDIAALINDILSLDFGSIIKEVQGNGTVIGATLNVDSVLAVLLGDVSVGDITLEYHLGDFEAENYNQNGGWLYGSLPSLGIEAYAYGSTASLTQPEKDEYLDINDLINSVLDLLNSNTVKVGLDLEGESLAAVLNANGITGYDSVLSGATLNVTGYASIKNTAAKADITLKITENTIFVASVYYAYTEGTYGIAYLNITNILGKEFSDLKVYCNISELAATIEGLLGSGVATLSDTTGGETNEIADIISQVLNINFGAMVNELAANASGLTATADLDEILGEFAGVDLSLGSVTLNYNITSNTLSGEALNGGLDIIVSGDEMTISEPADKDTYLDANKLLNSVLDLLNSNTVKVGLDLEGESLAAVLNANGITGYDSVLSGATLNVTGYASIKNTAAKADITLKNTEKTIFAASVYYAYTNDGTYGVAYLNITNILGKSFTDLKVYCNISELAATIEGLLGSGVAELDETTEPETNEIADIISQVLNINFGAMVNGLAANASGLTVTADLDEILGEFAGVDLSLGTVTLNYSITDNTLSGEALNGGLDIIVSGDTTPVSEPEDKDTYLDANKLLNSVLDLLNKNTVTVDLEIKGAAVADILGKANIADIGAAIDGLTLKVNGGVSIDDLAAAINLTLVGNDSATNEEKVYIDADIYYDYGDSGNSDGENYGTAYISINELLGVSFVEENTASDENTVSKVKVYADIAAAKNNVEALIEQITQIIEGALTPAQADYAVSTYSEDGENAVAGIIARVLGIDFTEFVSEMRTSADGFTATADIDYILSYFSVGEYGLGDVTLTYSIKDGTLIGSARQDGEDADWLGVTVGGKDEELVPPDESAYLDVNELVNSVRNLLASNTVALDIDLTGDKLAELLIANGVSSDYADLLKGLTLEIDGRASIADLAAEVSVKLYGGDTTYLEMSAFYNYDPKAADESGVVPSNYGEVYVNISKLLGNDSAIKVYCDITEAVESINTLLSEAAQAGVATLSESGGNALGLGDIQSIIEGVLTFDLTSLIGELSADAKGLTVTLNADELIGLFFDGSTVKVGTVTLTYNINNGEGAAVGTLSGSALGGGLKITVKGDANLLNAPDKDGYLNVNTVLDLINKAKAAAQEIIDSRSVYFALGDGANAGAEVEVNGINVGISGTGEVKWDENGTVTNLALDIKLWIANGSAENSKSTTTVKLIYNNAVADDEPFVTLAINNVGIKITQNDIAQMGNDVNNLIANVTALINALTGGSDGNGGNNGEITQQLLTALAEAAGESAATAPAGSVTPADTDYLAIVKLVLGLLGGDDDTVGGSLGNVLEEALSSLLSGSSVSVDELGDSLKLLLAGAADITLGVNDGALTLAGNISDIANLDISVSAGKFTNGAGTVASALEEQFNATTESGAVYTFYYASESGSFSKVIYDFVLGAYESIDIGSFLGGKTYQVTFRLAGDASQIEALKGVNVNATLYFGNGITNGELDKGKLLEADVDLSIDGFTFKANLFYNNRNFYISVSNIGGTSLSGLNVKVSANDIYAAAENIVALINNPNILALFTGADGEGAADIIGDGEGAENVSLLSDETSSSLTDVIAAILGMKLSDVITISNSGTETLVTADIDKVLSEFGVSQKVGPAQLVVDSGDSKKIALYLGNKDSEYNWLELVSELATDYNGSADSANLSSYIDIGFIDELISDLSKFITSNADSGDNGNISTLFSLTGGTINLSIDLSGVDMGLGGLGNSIVSGIVSAMDNIVIDNVNIVAGLKDGELYVSLKARINTVSAVGITIISGHEIGVTYSNGKITLSRYSGDSREYWIMTPEFFIDNMFAKNENGNDSPIRWIAGIEPILFNTVDIWGLVVDSLGDMVSGISSGTSQPDEVYLYNLYHANPVAATLSSLGYEMPSALANYLLGFEATAGGGVTVGNTEGVLENVEKPELADYYAISLNASALTGSVLDVLDIAISRSDKNGFGGIYAFASIQSRLLTVNFDIGYNGYDGDVFDSANDKYVPDYYAEAVAKAGGEDKIDFAYSKTLEENGVYYADNVFGGVQISADGTVGTIMPQTVYKNDALTITVYESEDDYNNKVNAQTMQVKYKSTIYLHSASGVMVDGEGNTYIFVQVRDDGSLVTTGEGENIEYPESVQITSNATFYKMKIDDDKYRAMNVTVHNTANGSKDYVTLTVYSGTSLTEIAQRAFGGYTVLDNKWQMLDEHGERVDYAPEGGNVTIPEGHEGGIYSIDLYAQFVRSEVTEKGVVYTFVQDDTELGGHYEISGYTSSLAVYYGAGSVLVLENDIDDVYPVTKIREQAFWQKDTNTKQFLQTVVVPENITTIGGLAFRDNKNMKAVIFLADNVYFEASTAISSSTKSQMFAFYGCNTSWDDTTETALHVYLNNFSTAEAESGQTYNNGWDVTIRLDGSTYGRATHHVNAWNENVWAYFDLSQIANESEYPSNEIVENIKTYLGKNGYDSSADLDSAVSSATGGLFVSSVTAKTTAELKSAIVNAITEAIDKATAEASNGATGMYNVSLSVTSLSDGTKQFNDEDDVIGAVKLSVNVTSTNEKWYEYSFAHLSHTDGADYSSDSLAGGIGGIEVSGGKVLGASSSSDITTDIVITPNPNYSVEKVTLNNVEYSLSGDNKFAVDKNGVVTISNVTVNRALDIVVYYLKTEVPSVTVYSPVDFTIDGNSFSSDEHVYAVDIKLMENSATAEGYNFIGWANENGQYVTESSSFVQNGFYYAIWTDTAATATGENKISSATTTAENTYFVGWAVDSGDSLQFANTVVPVVNEERVNSVYHAIWGVSSRAFEATVSDGANLPSSLTRLPDSDGSFDVSWYKSKTVNEETGEITFSDKTDTLVKGVYTYYARWTFNLTFTVNAGDTKLETSNGDITGNPMVYTIPVNEGNFIKLTYKQGSHQYGLGSSTTQDTSVTIVIYDTKTSDNGTTYTMRTKITKYEFAWNSTDRRLYIDSEDDYIGNWSVKECSSSQERIGDTNKDNYATDIVITGDAGITYGA